MAKSFYTQGTGSQQTLNDSQDEKIPVYATKALAQADLANLAEGQIIATKDGTADTQTLKDYVNFRYHDDDSQDADANTLTAPGVYSVHITDPTTQHIGVVETNGWCVIYVTIVDNNPDFVQQQLVDWFGHKWTRFSQAGAWSSWLSNFNYNSNNSGAIDANTLTTPGVYSILTPAGSESQNHVPTAGWCVIYVSRFDNNPAAVQQTLIDFEWGIWRRLGSSSWTEWNRDVIHKNMSISVESGVTLPSIFSALSYQLNHTDFSFLLAHPWQTATGGYELRGYYWGEYTATHTANNSISVIGVIDYNAKPHHFSAFYEPNVGWSFEIGGQEFVTESNGITLTRDTTSNRKYFMTQYATTTIQTIYDLLNYYGLLGRPMKGIFNWKMGMAHNYQYVPNATIDVGTGTLNAGQVAFFADPRIDAVDGTTSTWWIRWNDGLSAYACNLWGEVAASAECTWCTLEIWT